MRKIFFVLTVYLTLAITASAQVDELLTKFDAAGSSQRVAIANELFAKYLAQEEDTTYHFDNNANSDHLTGQVYYWAGDYYINQSKFDRAALYLNRALPVMRAQGDNSEVADCLAILGLTYTRLGDFKTAIKYQEEGLKLDRQSGDPNLISSSINNIAATYTTAGMIEPAVKYIEEGLALERTLNRPDRLAIRLGVASEINVKAGNLDKALAAAQEALDIESTKGNPDKVGVRKSQLGAVYKAMNKTSQAYTLLREAESDLRKVDNKNSLAITLNLLGDIEIEQKRFADAVTHLRESAALSKESCNTNSELSSRRMLCQALRNTNPAEAIVELERYAALKDSLYTAESAQSLALFNVKYENAEQQHNIEILKQRVKNTRLWLGILGAIIVGAAVALVLLGRVVRARDAKNKALIKANLLKDELLEIASNKTGNESDSTKIEKIEQVAEQMGSMGDMPQVKITRREREVMLLCCQGMLAKEVADRLNISVRTVESHKTNLYKKLGINNTVELIRYAQAIGAYNPQNTDFNGEIPT